MKVQLAGDKESVLLNRGLDCSEGDLGGEHHIIKTPFLKRHFSVNLLPVLRIDLLIV